MALNQPSLGIRDIRYYVPADSLSNDEIVEKFDFDRGFLDNKIGINQRRIAALDEATSDMAATACEKLFEETNLIRDAVECIIVVTQTPDYQLPHTAAVVQDKIGLSKSVASFDLSLGCSGFVYGLSVIQSFMQANGMKNGILVTAEQYSKYLGEGDRSTVPIFGDGAAATWISDQPRYLLGKSEFGSDGSGASDLIIRGSGTTGEELEPLHMNGRAIFNFMMTVVPENIETCLEKNGLGKSEIDLWVFHQASKFMLTSLAKRLKIEQEKLVIEVADIGNTTSSTIPIALARTAFVSDGEAKNLFISGFGVGLSWASAVLYAA